MDLAAALGALAERGYARVLAEGGPTLNGQLAAAGLLDELCLTVSPLLAGSGAKRILVGPALPSGSGWQIRSLCEQDGFLIPAVPPAIAGPTLPGRVRRGGPEGELPREDVRSVADRHQMLLERGLQDPDDGLPAGVVIWSFSTSVRRPGSGPRAASVYAAPAPTMKLVVSAGLLDAGRRTISRARRPGHDPAGCLHRRRDHLAAAGHGQRAGPGPCPDRRRDDHLAGSRHGALAGAGQCIAWTGPAAPPGTCRHGSRGHVDDLGTRLPDRHVQRVLVRCLSSRRTSRRAERRRGPADRRGQLVGGPGAVLPACPIRHGDRLAGKRQFRRERAPGRVGQRSCRLSSPAARLALTAHPMITEKCSMLTGRLAGPDRFADLRQAVLPCVRRRLRLRLPVGWFRAASRHGRRGRRLEAARVQSPSGSVGLFG